MYVNEDYAVNSIDHVAQEFSEPLWLGQCTYSATRFFDGQIDDARVYDRALNADEIKIVMLSSAGDENPYDLQIVADSRQEFSDTQGQDNWYYGYYDGDRHGPYTSVDFEELPHYDSNKRQWNIDDSYWTAIWKAGVHPHWNPKPAVAHWPVRRWISEVEGSVIVTGTLAKADDRSGDGIVGYILVDGVEVWSQYITYDDAVGVEYSIEVAVDIGSLVDFAVDYIENDGFDGTIFTATIKHIRPIAQNVDGD